MDFIPLPDGVASHVSVPDLGGPDYDNQGFAGYDLRQGWDVRALRFGRLYAARTDWESYERLWPCSTLSELGPKSQKTQLVLAAAFIQTWILFGIFHEVLKRSLLRHELSSQTSKDPSGNFVPTKFISVRHAFSEFLAGRRKWNQDLPSISHSIGCLHVAGVIISDFQRSPEFPKDSMVLHSVFQALAALTRSIYSTFTIFCPSLGTVSPLQKMSYPLRQKLQEQRGWCPNLTRRIDDTAGLYYAGLVPGLITEQVHDRCSDDLCIASNIDKENYSIQHVPKYCLCVDTNCDHKNKKCRCQDIAMPDAPFRTALEKGGFPLVRLQSDAIEVVEYKDGTSFFAISHPWSDGRGNPALNALPLCQLRAITECITSAGYPTDAAKFEASGLFWMDTLCVPVEEPLRNAAILRMAKVYSSAARTLVLSTELMAANRPSTTHETLLRISCSKWSTRLWLLHEAALARDLVFQFADGTVRQRTLFMKMLEAGLEPVDQTFLLTLTVNNSHIDGMVKIRANGINEFRNLESLWSALRYRTSSRVLDASICGSIILGTNLEKVLAVPDDKKMEMFWACQSRVPTNILFVGGPRLKTNGLRWAPSDLLSPEALSMPLNTIHISDKELEAMRVADCLLVTGIEVIQIEIPKAHRYESRCYKFASPGSPRPYYFWIDGSSDDSWIALVEELGSQWNGRCALFLGGLQRPQLYTQCL